MKSTDETLTVESFLAILPVMMRTGIWHPWIGTNELRGIIRLRRDGGHERYSPRTAVYYHLTGEEILNCFWLPEMTERFNLPWWQTLEIAYAEDACDVSRHHDRRLRNKILNSLGLPPERVYNT